MKSKMILDFCKWGLAISLATAGLAGCGGGGGAQPPQNAPVYADITGEWADTSAPAGSSLEMTLVSLAGDVTGAGFSMDGGVKTSFEVTGTLEGNTVDLRLHYPGGPLMKFTGQATPLASPLTMQGSLGAWGGGPERSVKLDLMARVPESPGPYAQVYKALGPLQCGTSGSSLLNLKEILVAGGIQPASASCGIDGLVHAAVCGIASGQIGIFQVPAGQLTQAAALGFASLDQLPNASPIPCQ